MLHATEVEELLVAIQEARSSRERVYMYSESGTYSSKTLILMAPGPNLNFTRIRIINIWNFEETEAYQTYQIVAPAKPGSAGHAHQNVHTQGAWDGFDRVAATQLLCRFAR